MNNQEFKTLRKSCFKTAKEASKYFNTSYETWKSWESGKRRVPGIAVEALKIYIEAKFCTVISFVSRTCELGTKGCFIGHDLKKGGKTYNKINNKGG